MKKAFATLLLLALIPVSQAALIDNGSYTTDTGSGLDWLDLTATENLSFTTVSSELTAGGALSGWRYASTAQVQALFTTVGLPITQTYGGALSPAYSTALTNLESLLGNTYAGYSNGNASFSNWSGIEGLTSQLEPVAGQPFHLRLGAYTYNYGGPNSALETASTSPTQGDLSASSYVGSYLVRDTSTVPLPASVWLLLSGFGALRALVRKESNGPERGLNCAV